MSHTIDAERRQLLLLPPSLDDWVPPEHPVRFVRDFVEALDLEELGFVREPGEAGRPHYADGLLLGVWLFGWMERIRSSRRLEKACLRDVAFMWLTGNLHPDHNTLWRFFKNNKRALRKLFAKVVRVSADAGLVGFALHAIDGTKLEAASSMETALHRSTLQKKLQKLEQIVAQQVAAIEKAESSDEPSWTMPEELRDSEARRERIRQLVQQRDLLDAAGTKHLHPAEPDARVMKGRKHKLLGYNAQAVVDHDSEMVVAADVTGAESDNAQLVPLLEQVKETTGRVAEQTVADCGYYSGEQLDNAERRQLPVLVGIQDRDTKGEYSKSSFQYDVERDAYVCPRGEVLLRETTRRRGTPQEVTGYRCRNLACPAMAQCTKDPKGRTIQRSVYAPAMERQAEKQRRPGMSTLLSLRGEIVEITFAWLKTGDGFRRFTARLLDGVRAQWALACTVLNLRKLYRHRDVFLAALTAQPT